MCIFDFEDLFVGKHCHCRYCCAHAGSVDLVDMAVMGTEGVVMEAADMVADTVEEVLAAMAVAILDRDTDIGKEDGRAGSILHITDNRNI